MTDNWGLAMLSFWNRIGGQRATREHARQFHRQTNIYIHRIKAAFKALVCRSHALSGIAWEVGIRFRRVYPKERHKSSQMWNDISLFSRMSSLSVTLAKHTYVRLTLERPGELERSLGTIVSSFHKWSGARKLITCVRREILKPKQIKEKNSN